MCCVCGRYTLADPSPLKRRFGLEESAETDVRPRFNVAPSQDIPIVAQQSDGTRELLMAKWGFVPHFMGEKPGKRPPPINARAETLATSGMFRSSVGTNRCIIPADGFYEWKIIDQIDFASGDGLLADTSIVCAGTSNRRHALIRAPITALV